MKDGSQASAHAPMSRTPLRAARVSSPFWSSVSKSEARLTMRARGWRLRFEGSLPGGRARWAGRDIDPCWCLAACRVWTDGRPVETPSGRGRRGKVPKGGRSQKKGIRYSKVILARVVVYDTMIWAVVGSRGCRVCARWPLVPLVLCRTRLLELGLERSAARQNALNELHALHASDQYDRMRGVCRGQRRGEGCWERKGEAMWMMDRRGWKPCLVFKFTWQNLPKRLRSMFSIM